MNYLGDNLNFCYVIFISLNGNFFKQSKLYCIFWSNIADNIHPIVKSILLNLIKGLFYLIINAKRCSNLFL